MRHKNSANEYKAKTVGLGASQFVYLQFRNVLKLLASLDYLDRISILARVTGTNVSHSTHANG